MSAPGTSGPISIFLNTTTSVGSITMATKQDWNTGNDNVIHLELADMEVSPANQAAREAYLSAHIYPYK